jgi:SAM-dependent methyltransferase
MCVYATYTLTMIDVETMQPNYDATFYRALEDGVHRSAKIAAEILWEVFCPKSVIDVGCGTGIWLAALRECGVRDLCGVDGPWVPRELLAIEAKAFLEHDLNVPLVLTRRFDLALCLEAAEHLPEEAAAGLVESLVRLAPVVIFSAAVPGQGGHGHINERWPRYWSNLFAGHGYQCSTALRNRLWDLDEVEPWYRQNILCFAEAQHADRVARLEDEASAVPPLDVVHPAILRMVRDDADAKGLRVQQLEAEVRALDAAREAQVGATQEERRQRTAAEAAVSTLRSEVDTLRGELEALRALLQKSE